MPLFSAQILESVPYDMPNFQAGTALCHVRKHPLAAGSSQWRVIVTVTAVMLDCMQNYMEKSFALPVAPGS